jgi:hypothetical protein
MPTVSITFHLKQGSLRRMNWKLAVCYRDTLGCRGWLHEHVDMQQVACNGQKDV